MNSITLRFVRNTSLFQHFRLLKRKTHKKSTNTEKVKSTQSAENENNDSNAIPAIDNDDDCISYFKSLKSHDIVCKENHVVMPSTSFDLNYVLAFPMININNNEQNNSQGIPYLQELKDYRLSNVTTVLSKTMPLQQVTVLKRWKEKMILDLGEEGFKQYQTEIFDNGSSLHHCIEEYLLGVPETDLKLREKNDGHWKSLKSVFPNVDDVKLLEKTVTHPYLMYKGVIDCVAKYKDELVLIEWKTSKKHKRTFSSIYDNPLQAAAYVGALNYDPEHDIQVNSAVVVVAYENGDPGDVHYMPTALCYTYWKDWLKRLSVYWKMMNVP